jgi:hypothetical protein
LKPLSIEAVSSIEDDVTDASPHKRYGIIKIEDLTLFFVAFQYFLSLEGIAAQRRGLWTQPKPKQPKKTPQGSKLRYEVVFHIVFPTGLLLTHVCMTDRFGLLTSRPRRER